MKNKRKGVMNKKNFKKKEEARTGKVTEADIKKLKEHFDKKFGRK